jgi:hypothetical protein
MLVIRQILLLISTGIILAPHCNKLFAPIPASEPVAAYQQTPASVPVAASEEIPVGEAVRQELFTRIPASEPVSTYQQTAASVPVPVYDEVPVGEAVRQELFARMTASEPVRASVPVAASEEIPVREAVRQKLFPRIQASEPIPPRVLNRTNKVESPTTWELLWKRLPKGNEFFWQIFISVGSCLIDILFPLMTQQFLRRFWYRDQTEEKRKQQQMLLQEADVLIQEFKAIMELRREMKRKYLAELQNEMDSSMMKMKNKLRAEIYKNIDSPKKIMEASGC